MFNQIATFSVCSNVTMQRGAERVSADAGFEAFYRLELRAMTALATALVGSREAGADLAHEAMLRAYRAWTTVGTLDRPGAWCRRVLINLAIDAHRRRQRDRRSLERLGPRPPMESDSPVGGEFWDAVRALPERQRAVVALRYIDDFSIDEIAAVLCVSAGTVKTSLFIARKKLAITMSAEQVHDDDD